MLAFRFGFGSRAHRRPIPWAIIAGFLVCVLAVGALSGCAINRASASVSPDVDLPHFKKFYVARFVPDERGVNKLIETELVKMGYQASTGLDIDAPKDVDAIVTYQDKWMWDITMYMLELKVFVRAPKSDRLLASATSYHTSLTRKTPEEMVAEALGNIFAEAKKQGTPRAQ